MKKNNQDQQKTNQTIEKQNKYSINEMSNKIKIENKIK